MTPSNRRGFEEAFSAVTTPCNGEYVSPELRPLLEAAYSELVSESADLSQIKRTLEKLLLFLSGPGRTNANCWAVDLFFGFGERWEADWADRNFPEELHDVLAYMGEALHDTVQAPHIAANFGCLPEQLLERVRQLNY